MNNTVLPPDEAKAIAKLQQLYLKTERKLINEITRKRSLKLVDYAEVAEWQTRWLQVPVVAISCGFKSHLLHD